MPPVKPDLIGPRHQVIDIIYNPWETELLRRAAKRGAAVVNGYGMLAYQAAEAFRLWIGQEPPIDVMWRAGTASVKERAR